MVLDVELFSRVDLRSCLWLAALKAAEFLHDRFGPSQPVFVRHTHGEFHVSVDHVESDLFSEFDLLVGLEHELGEFFRVLVVVERSSRLPVVHPLQIGAGPLGHDANEGRLVRRHIGWAEPVGDMLCEAPVVVRGHGGSPEIVH